MDLLMDMQKLLPCQASLVQSLGSNVSWNCSSLIYLRFSYFEMVSGGVGLGGGGGGGADYSCDICSSLTKLAVFYNRCMTKICFVSTKLKSYGTL